MIIHFFRERIKPRIDFFQLIDGYFDALPNSKITSNDDEVIISMNMKNFDFKYSYYITKRSRVSSLYRLNPDFININLFVDIPFFIPQYISRIIFKEISDICEKFELQIYYDKYDNIRPFNMFELIDFLGKERIEYLDNNPDIITYRIRMNILNDMCNYQNLLDFFPTLIKEEVVCQKYTILADRRSGEVRNSIIWKAGTAMVFPPHLNYIQVLEQDNLVALIPKEMFFRYAEKYMYEIKDESINFKVLYLNEKGANKVHRLVKKMKKAMLSLTDFTTIRLTELIEY